MQEFKNIYEIRKSLRFELLPTNNEDILKPKNIDYDLNEFVEKLKDFLYKFKNTIFYYSEEQDIEKMNFRKWLEIKYVWLKNYTKNDFYNWTKKKDKTYKLNEIIYLKKYFFYFFDELYEIILNLEEIVQLPKENQGRKSNIAYYLRKLNKKDVIDFIYDFLKYIHNPQNPKTDKFLNDLKEQIENIKNTLLELNKQFLPLQSSWLEVAKATFNYYTIDKYSKINFDKQIENRLNELYKSIFKLNNHRLFKVWINKEKRNFTITNKFLEKIWFFDYLEKERNFLNFLLSKLEINKEEIENKIKILDKVLVNKDFKVLNLDEAYELIKEFKANAKSHFTSDLWAFEFRKFKIPYSKITKENKKDNIEGTLEINYENFLNIHPLFEISDDDFKKLKELTEEINNYSLKKNNILQKLKLKKSKLEAQIKSKQKENWELNKEEKDFLEYDNKIWELTQKRWKYFNKPWEKVYSWNYFYINEFFKNIALERGRIKAEIKWLEEEKNQARLLKYWSLITEKDESKYLILIPKGNRWNVKEKLEEFWEEKNDVTIYYFKSLTLRALQKLCFKSREVNTFMWGKNWVAYELLQINLDKGYININKKWKKLLKRYDELKNEEQEVIQFYQDVLKSKNANKQLDLVDFGWLDEVLNKNYSSIEDFRIDLEKVCYVKIPKQISKEDYDKLLEKNNILEFEITSQDLRIQKENYENLKNHKNKEHTKKWLNFWSEENNNKNYPIRLNPEIKILYREALQEKKWDYKNRYTKEQFTLTTTLWFNIPSKKFDFSFNDTRDIKEKIDNFNNKFNKEFNWPWYYGIDRWINELATLTVVKWTDETYNTNWIQINKPEFAEIEVYKLKDENKKLKIINYKWEEKEVNIIDNISYFLDQENLFEKIITSTIDLTQAKLINWKIVLNGDKNTYLKLKKLSAQRRLFELFSKNLIAKNSQFEAWKKILFVKRNDNNYEPIYWFTEEQKKNKELQKDIIEELKKYLEDLENKNIFEDTETIEKINHLRDAITANIVWIIYFLQKKYPWKIYLENLETKAPQQETFSFKKWKSWDYTEIEEKMIDGHFRQSNTDISRRLEWWLYRKFQESWFVPSNLKQTILLKDEFKQYQFGIINFIKVKATSSTCPYCEIVTENKWWLKKHIKEDNNCKLKSNFQEDKDKIKNCIYKDLYNNYQINYDSIASYTIAKFGKKNLFN